METYKLKYSGEEVDETLQLTNDETKGNEALKVQLDNNTTKVTTLSSNVSQLKSEVLTAMNSLHTEVQERSKQDNILMSYINNKQDTLTAGSGITIKNNIISADGGEELAQEIWDRKQADSHLQTNINNTNSALDEEVRNRTSDVSDIKDSIRVIKNEYATADATLQENIDTKVSKSGDTMTGKLVAPKIETGSDTSNYFQSRKFRGEGDANTYYHAIDFGYAGHNQVDFYEYGGVYNFWKNTSSTAGGTKVASLQLGKLVERNNELTYPNKSGTIALTSDVDVKQDKLTAGDNITIEGNVISAITGKADIDGEKEAREEADNALQAQIDTLTSNLESETTSRKNYDETLRLSIVETNNKLTSETMNRQAQDSTLQINIDNLNTTKQDKLTAGTNITIDENGVISAKGGGSGDVTSDQLNQEISDRKDADSVLQSNIDKKQDTLIAGTNIVIKDGVISAIGGGDVTSTQLQEEISNREKADNALQSNIDTLSEKLDNEITRATTKEDELERSISNVNILLSNEVNHRQESEATLQSNIDNKQDKLIAGTGITIVDNVISSQQLGYNAKYNSEEEMLIFSSGDITYDSSNATLSFN